MQTLRFRQLHPVVDPTGFFRPLADQAAYRHAALHGHGNQVGQVVLALGVLRLDQRHGIEHVLAERPHDVGVVILEGEAEVADAVVEQAGIAEMAAEAIDSGKARQLLADWIALAK